MTDAIGATGAYAAAAAASTTSSSGTSATGFNAMGSDAFLKLLVAQLKYQDPSHPTDGTQMMAQTAQFQMVEKLQQLDDQNTQLLAEQQTLCEKSEKLAKTRYSVGEAPQSDLLRAQLELVRIRQQRTIEI